MLLDEPSFGLAPLIVQEIFRIMRRINAEAKVSMLLVEQNAALALDLADHAYVLETGRIVMSGKAAADQERRGVRKSYLGLLRARRMEQLIQQTAAGLANGAIYASLALALVMIFVSTNHINFAQGEMAMFSAYLAWQLLQWGLSFWIALPLVMVLSFVIGVAIERTILRPLHSAPVLSVVVVFIGLLTIFHALAGGIWTHTIKAVPVAVPAGRHSPAPATSGSHQLGMIAVTVMVLLALFAFFRFTPLGLAMRAAAQNPASARLAGISVDWMLALGWGLAAAVGAVAGCMVAPAVYLEPNMMASILLYGFAGALVGGISSPGGAVAGGFIVGVLENLIAYLGNVIERATGVYIVGNGEKLTVALIIVIAVLTLKPSGLFGHVTVQRV